MGKRLFVRLSDAHLCNSECRDQGQTLGGLLGGHGINGGLRSGADVGHNGGAETRGTFAVYIPRTMTPSWLSMRVKNASSESAIFAVFRDDAADYQDG